MMINWKAVKYSELTAWKIPGYKKQNTYKIFTWFFFAFIGFNSAMFIKMIYNLQSLSVIQLQSFQILSQYK